MVAGTGLDPEPWGEGESQCLLGPTRQRTRCGSDISNSYRKLALSYNHSVKYEGKETELLRDQGTSWPVSALILTNVIIGVGLLNYPRAFVDSGGLYWALPAQLICIVFVILGLVMLGQCTNKCEKETLEDLVEYYTGRTGLIFINFFILIHNFGSCITFLVIIADQADSVMQMWFGQDFCHFWYLDRSFTVPLISVLFILPLCFIKNIADFKFASYVGILTTAYIVFIVIWYYFGHDFEGVSPEPVRSSNWGDVFKVVPTICFSFEAHIESVPLFYTTRKPHMKHFIKTVVMAVFLSAIVYVTVGVFGVLTFGHHVSADMLTNYPASDPLVIVGAVMLGIKAITTYPIILFCTRSVVNSMMVSMSSGRWSERFRHYTSTLILFFGTLLCSLVVPSIGGMISLLGFSGAIFVFIIPGVCFVVEYSLWVSGKAIRRGLIGGLFLVAGAVVGGISTTQSVQRILSGEFSSREVSCS